MKIALAQMQITSEIEANFEKTVQMIKKAALNGADLICFPEIQLTPFFPQYENRDVSAYIMNEHSQYVTKICEVCRESGIYAVPNFYMEENSKKYDMSLLIDDKGLVIGKQKMVHVAQCENFYECDYYTPSEEGFQVFETKFGKIGIVVCFDRHYPESIRTEALRGAELIIIPTANTTAEPSELFQWEVKVQAFQNSVNIAMCNRVGKEENMFFSGESIVCDYNGNTVAIAKDTEELLITQVRLPEAAEARLQKTYTALRKPSFYD